MTTRRYLVVTYRPNGTSWCRGHLEYRTESDFEISEHEDRVFAVEALAEAYFRAGNEVRTHLTPYGERRSFVYVDGVGFDSTDEIGEPHPLCAEAHAVALDARAMADDRLDAKTRKEAAAEERRKEAAAAAERDHDLRQLAALKKKLGVP